jgi:hypothetical protein
MKINLIPNNHFFNPFEYSRVCKKDGIKYNIPPKMNPIT